MTTPSALSPGQRIAAWLFLSLAGIAGGCIYPQEYRSGNSPRSTRVTLYSEDSGVVTLDGRAAAFRIEDPIEEGRRPRVSLAPDAPDGQDRAPAGAFALWHGTRNSVATLYWWDRFGELRAFLLSPSNGETLSIKWIDHRLAQLKSGNKSIPDRFLRLGTDGSVSSSGAPGVAWSRFAPLYHVAYPRSYSAGTSSRDARVILLSNSTAQAVRDGRFVEWHFSTADDDRRPVVAMADTDLDQVPPPRRPFGAFGLWQVGQDARAHPGDSLTLYWWDDSNDLRSFKCRSLFEGSMSPPPLGLTWINHRAAQVHFKNDGTSRSDVTFRLFEDGSVMINNGPRFMSDVVVPTGGQAREPTGGRAATRPAQ